MNLDEYSIKIFGKHWIELSDKDKQTALARHKAYKAVNELFNPDLRIFG